MKKVVYSVSRTNRYGSTKMTGLGFVTESDLIIACNGKSGKAYIRVFKECVMNCHAVPNRRIQRMRHELPRRSEPSRRVQRRAL